MAGNYYDLGEYDLKIAYLTLNDLNLDYYNVTAMSSQQCVEKLLKHLYLSLNISFSDEIVTTHNLNTLLKGLINHNFKELRDIKDDCRFLSRYYVEIRYPSDNFMWVSREDAIKCYDCAVKAKSIVDDILFSGNYAQHLQNVLMAKFNNKNSNHI